MSQTLLESRSWLSNTSHLQIRGQFIKAPENGRGKLEFIGSVHEVAAGAKPLGQANGLNERVARATTRVSLGRELYPHPFPKRGPVVGRGPHIASSSDIRYPDGMEWSIAKR
jgi:hypothetical protein